MTRVRVKHDLSWIKQRTKLTRTGCWQWLGSKSEKGYGLIHPNVPPRRPRRAHRVVWQLTHGPIPNGLCVLHKCDNPSCVNPEHLFLGTNADNTRDMQEKGRGIDPPRMCGENHPQHKLTWDDVREIRRLCSSGHTQKAVAEMFPVSHAVINKIVLRKLWREQ